MELSAIVLAGGAGSRFGGRKLLAPWRSGVLLDGALAAALSAPAATLILVTGADAEDIAAAARRFLTARGCNAKLSVAHASDHAAGLAASLRTGLAALPGTAEGAFIFLGDMPLVPAGIGAALAQALDAPGVLAAAPVHEGQRGHPVLVRRAVIPELLALQGDHGARPILDRLGPALALVPASDPGVLQDVDRPDQLAALEKFS
jgi:molybdenum cofactor cytidylyltransferase